MHKTLLAVLASALLMFATGCDRRERGNSDTLTAMHQAYDKARNLQLAGKGGEAVDAYKRLLASACLQDTDTAASDETVDSLLPIVADAMVQLLNSYQSEGRQEQCVVCFDSLVNNPPPYIYMYARRELYMAAAYATSRTDSMARAERLADSALAIKSYHPTPRRLFRDYAYAAAVFFPNPEREEQVVSLCRKALDEAEEDGNVASAQYVTSMLGMLYKRNGRLADAVELYLDSRATSLAHGDSMGMATACNALAELYLYWKIPKYADIYATDAVNICSSLPSANPMTAVQSLLLKSKVLECLGRNDSAQVFFHRAETISKQLPYTSGQADADYQAGYFLVNHSRGDSLQRGIRRLENVVAKGTPLLRAKAFYQLATAYLNLHCDDDAAAMLDSTYNILHAFTPTKHIDIDYRRVIDFYADRGDNRRARLVSADLLDDYYADANTEIRTRMYENIVDMQTEAQKQQMEAQRLTIENERLYYRLWLSITVGIVLLLALFIGYKRKLDQAKQQLMETKLSSLLDELERANRDRRLAERRLSEANAQNATTTNGSEDNTKESIELKPANFLRAEGEMSFRRRFDTFYPLFIGNLRTKLPGISRREELMCMLICLGQDAHQAAYLLGINYRSAVVARYRLRQKLGLNKEDSLETAIKAMV